MALLQGVPPLRYYICEAGQSALQPLAGSGTGLVNHINAQPQPTRLTIDIDFLMRFEHLDDDFKLVCEKINIPYVPLPKRNQSSHAHYSKYYDAELKAIVGMKFHEEIVFGNYTFENVSSL
ncbi:hypothetical protein [Trichothermofontia sp.]